jgi:hypothetical protein
LHLQEGKKKKKIPIPPTPEKAKENKKTHHNDSTGVYFSKTFPSPSLLFLPR